MSSISIKQVKRCLELYCNVSKSNPLASKKRNKKTAIESGRHLTQLDWATKTNLLRPTITDYTKVNTRMRAQQALELIDTVASFLISMCLAYLALVNVDLPSPQTPPQGDSSPFDTFSGMGKSVINPSDGGSLLKFAYLFVQWLRLIARYASWPLALTLSYMKTWFGSGRLDRSGKPGGRIL